MTDRKSFWAWCLESEEPADADRAKPVLISATGQQENAVTLTLDPELFLPEPTQAEVRYTVISVDDHVVEPPHLFDEYMSPRLRQRGPKVIKGSNGEEVWEFEGEIYSQGLNAVAGRRLETMEQEPSRFEHMRPGCYDADARIADMDIAGIWAMLNFPSRITGFCGRVFAAAQDQVVGLDCVRAWNDWLFAEWFEPHPTRVIPGGITYLGDSEQAVAEIHRNAERGFVSVTMPDRPHLIGMPSLWERDFWDPIIQACVDTDTVISLHVGSSGSYPVPPGAPSLKMRATMFPHLSLCACAEWLWSDYPVKHPDLKIAMTEGGIGWVPMLLDRLDKTTWLSNYTESWDEHPADVLRRNFWFCTIDDPSTIDCRHTIGIENIMVETDYPHSDSTWPETQDVIERYWGHIPTDELRAMCCENAARVYRHPLPEVVLPR